MNITPVRTVQDWAVEYDTNAKDFYLTGVGLDKSDIKIFQKEVVQTTKSHLMTSDTIFYIDNPNREFVDFCLKNNYQLNVFFPFEE
jgi:hypothetical protein